MLILLFIALTITIELYKKNVAGSLISAARIVQIFLLAAIICVLLMSFEKNDLKKQVEEYTQANVQIEHNLKDVIKNYLTQKPETNLYFSEDEKEGDGYYVTLINTIPELSSLDIVKSKTNEFNSNNTTISQLKEKIDNYTEKEWYAYFGK